MQVAGLSSQHSQSCSIRLLWDSVVSKVMH